MTTTIKSLLSVIVGVICLATSVVYLSYAKSANPIVTNTSTSKSITLVDVIAISDLNANSVTVKANGTVEAKQLSHVNARLSGHVDSISPALSVGSRVKKGELLLSLSNLEAKVALAEAELDLADARIRVVEERGEHRQAKRDIQAYSSTAKASELAKRIPQLQAAEANFKAKEIAVEKAKVDLANTKITAPFNGVILSKEVNQAEYITTNTALFTLVADSEPEISLPLTLQQWQLIDDKRLIGAEVKIKIQDLSDSYWAGVVSAKKPELDTRTGSLPIIIKVNDKERSIPFGAFAQVELLGKTFSDTMWVPQIALVDTKSVWGVSNEHYLKKLSIDVLQYAEDKALILYKDIDDSVSHIIAKPKLDFFEGQTVAINKIQSSDI